MVTDGQALRVFKMVDSGSSIELAALKAGMSPKTAGKYLKDRELPSETKSVRTHRTRVDPFEDAWPEIEGMLVEQPNLEAKTLFDWLQRERPGEFQDGQLRTLQRRLKTWRAVAGPPKEVFFDQVHVPGKLGASDFTCMNSLAVTVAGVPLPHLMYHFVLTYSNWEHVSICFSESFEALCAGMQAALWSLGRVPELHRTDQLTAAVQQITEAGKRAEFTRRYQELLGHYGIEGRKIQPSHGNENGDAEQSHHRFKRRLDQALMLRGSRDFTSQGDYLAFVSKEVERMNAGRRTRLAEELAVMRPLPPNRIDVVRRLECRVDRGSLIRVDKNTYSVTSRLIGTKVTVLIRQETLEIWVGQSKVDELPRLRGAGKTRINYRHVIDTLVRKPGAFAEYRHREELFPTTFFRIAFDSLSRDDEARGTREYLKILHLAARSDESAVNAVLRFLVDQDGSFDAEVVRSLVEAGEAPDGPPMVEVQVPDLAAYDQLRMDDVRASEVAA